MNQERVPREPAREQRPDDRESQRAAEIDNEFQPDPQLTEGPASRGRIATYAVVIVLIFGAVIYGLNTANRQRSTQPPTQTTQNSQPGMTTGTAPSHPTPPRTGPTGADINRASQPPFAGESR